MNKDLEKFENRSDDWLADQIRLESRVSAWDLDEGAKIKKEHELHHDEIHGELPDTEERRYDSPEKHVVTSKEKNVIIAVLLISAIVFLIIVGSFFNPTILFSFDFIIVIIVIALVAKGRKK